MFDKKYFSQIGFVYLMGGLFSRLVAEAVSYVLVKVRPEWLMDTNISLFISSILVYGIGLPLIILMMRTIPGRSPEKKPLKVYQWLGSLLMSLPVIYGANILGIILAGIIGAFKGGDVDNAVVDVVVSINPWVGLVLLGILAPLMEELVFRKLLIDRIHPYGKGIAVLMSALMFGLYHGNLNQFMYAFGLGIFLAVLYLKTGKIIYTMGIHMCINVFSGSILPLLLEQVDFNEYYRLAMEQNMSGMEQNITSHMTGWLLLGMVMLIIIALAITGLVLLILYLINSKAAQKSHPVPEEERFNVPEEKVNIALGNPGMIGYCVFWIVMIVIQFMA